MQWKSNVRFEHGCASFRGKSNRISDMIKTVSGLLLMTISRLVASQFHNTMSGDKEKQFAAGYLAMSVESNL